MQGPTPAARHAAYAALSLTAAGIGPWVVNKCNSTQHKPCSSAGILHALLHRRQARAKVEDLLHQGFIWHACILACRLDDPDSVHCIHAHQVQGTTFTCVVDAVLIPVVDSVVFVGITFHARVMLLA